MSCGAQSATGGSGTVPEQVWEDPDVPASRYGSDPAVAGVRARVPPHGIRQQRGWPAAPAGVMLRKLLIGNSLHAPGGSP